MKEKHLEFRKHSPQHGRKEGDAGIGGRDSRRTAVPGGEGHRSGWMRTQGFLSDIVKNLKLIVHLMCLTIL